MQAPALLAPLGLVMLESVISGMVAILLYYSVVASGTDPEIKQGGWVAGLGFNLVGSFKYYI